MTRWLKLNGRIINLDNVTAVVPHGHEGNAARVQFVDRDSYVLTAHSVEEVYRLIECAEGPEPPKARE